MDCSLDKGQNASRDMEKPISDELRQKLRERGSKGGKAGSHESKVKAGRLGFRAMFRALTGTEYQPKTNT